MVDQAPYVNTYTWLDIFYKSTLKRKEDYLTIEEYLFRYDVQCHWLSRTIPGMETKLMRFFLGKLLLILR